MNNASFKNEVNNLIAVRNKIRDKLKNSKGDTTNHEQMTKVEMSLNKFLENKDTTLHQKQSILEGKSAHLNKAVQIIKHIQPDNASERKFKQELLKSVKQSSNKIETIFEHVQNMNDNILDNSDGIMQNGQDIKKNRQINQQLHNHTHTQLDQLQDEVNIGNQIALVSTAVTVGTAVVKTVDFAVRVGPSLGAFAVSLFM